MALPGDGRTASRRRNLPAVTPVPQAEFNITAGGGSVAVGRSGPPGLPASAYDVGVSVDYGPGRDGESSGEPVCAT